MAGLAVGLDHLVAFAKGAVLDLGVAVETLDFVLRHMDFVQPLVIVVGLNPALVVVTDETAFPGCAAVSLDDLGVAPGAVHIKALDVTVIEGEGALLDDMIGHLMAGLAIGESRTHFLILEMAEDTGGGRDGDVTALDDLGVA